MKSRAVYVIFGFRSSVCSPSFFRIIEEPQVHSLHVHGNRTLPHILGFAPVNTGKSAFVGLALALILAVFCSTHLSKIFESVVASIPVDVVNLHFRPEPGHVEPSETMRLVGSKVDFDNQIAFVVQSARHIAGFELRPPVSDPAKFAGGRIVSKQFLESLKSNIGGSHEAPVMLIGEKPVSSEMLSGFAIIAGLFTK